MLPVFFAVVSTLLIAVPAITTAEPAAERQTESTAEPTTEPATEPPGHDAPTDDQALQGPPAHPGTVDEIALEQRLFNRQYDAQEYAPAIETGKRLVVLAIERHGTESPVTAKALTSLALAQSGARNLDAARDNFQAAIDAIEASSDRLAKELIDPLRGLGAAELQARRPDAAADSLERAVHVSQVNDGPQNLDQIGMLAELSEAYFQLGDFKQADALQKYTVGLVARRYPDNDDKRRVPTLYQRAFWLVRMGQFLKAQGVYMHIIRIVERSDGKIALDLLPALNGLAKTYVYTLEDGGREEGERRLRRAISITKKNDEASPLQHADAEIGLGDYLNLVGEKTGSKRAYARAWDVLGEEDDLSLLAARDERFAQPVPLNSHNPAPETVVTGSAADFRDQYGDAHKSGYVSVAYEVSARGRVRNARIVESEPPGFKDAETLSRVNRFAFRPRFVEGEPVDTPDLQYRYDFKYLDSELSGSTSEATDTPGDDADPESRDDGERNDGERSKDGEK